MFKNLILAAFVAVSFAGAILTSATPAAADDDFDALSDSTGVSFVTGSGAGRVDF